VKKAKGIDNQKKRGKKEGTKKPRNYISGTAKKPKERLSNNRGKDGNEVQEKPIMRKGLEGGKVERTILARETPKGFDNQSSRRKSSREQVTKKNKIKLNPVLPSPGTGGPEGGGGGGSKQMVGRNGTPRQTNPRIGKVTTKGDGKSIWPNISF